MSTAFATESEFAVVLLTQDGTIVDAHPTCFESLGWTREELAGKDIGELLQSDRELLMAQLLQSKDEELGVDGQTSFSLRILARRRDETSFPARVVVRRFDQTGCCTAAFYRVTPHNESDTAPTVRPEEIELAMRGNTTVNPSAGPKPEKPKSRWRNARLLFGSKPQAPAQPAAPVTTTPPVQAPSSPVQSVRPAPKFHPQVPENLFVRKDAPPVSPQVPPPAQAEEHREDLIESATPIPEEQQPVALTAARQQNVEFASETAACEEDAPTDRDSLLRELEQEREERRRLEQRATALASQVSALHLQVSENLEIESRNQKKVGTLEEQVREARNHVTQLKSDLATERQKSAAAEQKIEAANAVANRTTEQLEALKLVHEALNSTQAECESQLKSVIDELKQAQNALASETAKRHELERSLAAAQQEQAESERRAKLELSKSETALKAKELELKELQTKHAQQALQSKS